jgi:CRISP-associated protein Cas1
MTTLYITQPDAVVNKSYEAFTVSLKQPDGQWQKRSVPAQTIEQMVLMGNPQVTGDAFVYALELGMPIHYLSSFGKYLGSALPGTSRNGQLRLAQYGRYYDVEKRLALVQAIVMAKIHNQHAVLYRHGQKESPLKDRKKAVMKQGTIDQVRGMEGLAAREYFSFLPKIVGEQWGFLGRHRPPPDPLNALLSFGYGLLRSQVTAAVHIAGLDPYIGYLHETTRGQPAMVLDLMEEFRPLVADAVVMTAANHRVLKPEDFESSLGAFRLKDEGRKAFLQAFEAKLSDEFMHPVFEYKCTYRRAIELQARLLARHLQEDVPYKGFCLR